MKTTVSNRLRRTKKTVLVLVALGGTLGALHAAPVRDAANPQVGIVTATSPSMASFIGVGGLSLIGMLALRRRVRGYQA